MRLHLYNSKFQSNLTNESQFYLRITAEVCKTIKLCMQNICGIMYHYPIYGDRPLIGRSNLLYACTHRSFALFSAGIAGRLAYSRPEKERG